VSSAPDRSELVGAQAGLAAVASAETHGELGQGEIEVRAKGYWEQVWIRFKRDKVAIASGVFIIFLVFVAIFGGPIAQHYLGHSATAINQPAGAHGIEALPVGPWSHVACKDFYPPATNCKGSGQQLYVLGADGVLGHDEFLRLLYGARISLEVAILATLAVMILGIILGTTAGYYRGLADTAISRVIELTMVFPALLFIIALSATVGPRLNQVTFHGLFAPGVVTLVLVFAIFGWFYPARILRAQVLSLREKEFVEAARMIGASDGRIMRSHVIPHLVAPIIVYSTLTVATYILLEAGLSFLGLGIDPVNPSWGNLLATAPTYYTTQPWLMVWPGLAILMTTLAFNLLGDGLRDAVDPRSSR
jgi:peptide/nickel transport system permease protein